MSAPCVTAVVATSPAENAGLLVGDELLSLNGKSPRDIIEYHQIVDGGIVEVVVRRKGHIEPDPYLIDTLPGTPMGMEISSALFDRVRTCDNHCSFCFIYQLPKGMRKSLYLKDDDYRLSFLYGNFTTLTRFTELDLERVIDERLGPLYVSIHATDPHVRHGMLKNPKGATSLRWLRLLLENGIDVHGQIVVCPGVNDAEVLTSTLGDIFDDYTTLSSVGIVPLGISNQTNDPTLRSHTRTEALQVIDIVHEWQGRFLEVFTHRMAYLSDEYYLLAGIPFPPASNYAEFAQHENGIGMASAFAEEFCRNKTLHYDHRGGFFQSVDGAPHEGYRPVRIGKKPAKTDQGMKKVVVTSTYGAQVLEPLLSDLQSTVSLLIIENDFFGGNIGVAGLMCGVDIAKAMEAYEDPAYFLIPDVCLNEGRFLDGMHISELAYPLEVIETNGKALRKALEGVRQ